MRAILLTVLSAVFVLLATPAAGGPDTDWKAHMGGLPFVVGIERGREESRFTGLPQMLVFTSASDANCPKFADAVWTVPDIRTKVAGWTPVLIDFDTADPELKQSCKVEVVPSVVWLDHDEKPIWGRHGNASLEVFRVEATKALRICPKPKAPAAGLKVLQEAKRRLEEAEAAADVRAQFAAIALIRKIRLGEAVQVAARAADERLTDEGLAAVALFAAVLDEEHSPPAEKASAVRGLAQLFDLYGGEHAVGRKAKAALLRSVPEQT